MKFVIAFLAATILLSVSGCEVLWPSIRLQPPIVIEPAGGGRDRDREGDDGGRYHCPPGQAKKGNC